MNTDVLVGTSIVLGVALIMGLIIRTIVMQKRKAYANLRRIGARLNLTVPEVTGFMGMVVLPDATGTIRGKEVRLYTYVTGSSKNRRTWVAVDVKPKATGGLTFALKRQGWNTKVMELFGVEEIQVGDPEFDREWFIQTSDPEFLPVGLLPEMRNKISAHHGLWKLKEGLVTYAEYNAFLDDKLYDRIPEIVDAACDLADAAEVYAQQNGGGQS